MSRQLILACCLLVASCGAGALDVELRSALDQGLANELKLVEELEDERVRVRGDVSKIGVKAQKGVVHDFEYGPLGATGTSRRVTRHYGFATLVPGDGQPGRALCFFARDSRSDAASLTKGARVELECSFQQFAVKKSGPVLVLNQCELP